VLCRAGHPGHLISFVETDLEAYSLSNLQPFLGANYSEMRLPDLRVRVCKGCDATRTPPWPCRSTHSSRARPVTRDADEGEPLQSPGVRPST
jgi:hypothetical protein